ncbi:MAG: YkvA family protein [Oscillospiraceae bacterium]
MLKQKVSAVLLAFRRKDTPILAKIFAGLTVAYALSPIDIIPDFIPVLGYLDDLLILPAMIALCIKLIPKHIMAQCEEQAKSKKSEALPKKWYFAVPIILIWVLAAALVLYIVLN